MKKFTAIFAATAVALTAAGCSAQSGFLDEAADADFMGGVLNGAMGVEGAGFDGTLAAPEASPGYGWDYDAAGDIIVGNKVEGDTGIGTEDCFVEPQAGMLTGGEWKDNDHWSYWLSLHDEWNTYRKKWKTDWDARIAVNVIADGKPAENAKVSCDSAAFSSVTDNKGRAYLFFSSEDHGRKIRVEYNGEKRWVEQIPESGEITVVFDSAENREKSLDLMIMCDTTGSMSDELEYLKTELSDIIRRVKNENANLFTRISVNFYRDEGDEYVVRPFEFTTDVNTAVSQINAQIADGGGDFPEAVHTALNNAVNEHFWDENAVKIMFLVLDAPAHDDFQVIASLNNYVAQAAEKGIRIIPVASSGIDKSTEYLLRTMAIQTGGTYTFLTNHSGIGGDHIEATVGAYNVEKLGDMMVRIVGEYLK